MRSDSLQHPERALESVARQRLPRDLPEAAEMRPGSLSSENRAGPVWQIERWLAKQLLRALGNPQVRVVLWDGKEIPCQTVRDTASTAHRVWIGNRSTLWKVALNPLYQFPEAYADGRVEIDGSLAELLGDVYRSLKRGRKRGPLVGRLFQSWQRPHETSRSKSRHNIHRHYDLGNDFYQLWLDQNMVYTCAYFSHPAVTLEQAQIAKMDHVCRKLCLQPGMTVLEAGCGWGSFALHMARYYGVNVHAYNISQQQIDYARDEAKRQGLNGQVQFIKDDWRNMSDRCDVFVSIGMLEHVGARYYRRLGDVIEKCLRHGGRGLMHFIGQDYPVPFNRWIERHIFPGAYPPALSEATKLFEPHGFSILDVENLRPHYAQTLWHWLQRFEEHADIVRSKFDERFVRSWRMYLSGSTASFRTGGLQLYQVLFSKGPANDMPWTRDYMYNGIKVAQTED